MPWFRGPRQMVLHGRVRHVAQPTTFQHLLEALGSDSGRRDRYRGGLEGGGDASKQGCLGLGVEAPLGDPFLAKIGACPNKVLAAPSVQHSVWCAVVHCTEWLATPAETFGAACFPPQSNCSLCSSPACRMTRSSRAWDSLQPAVGDHALW